MLRRCRRETPQASFIPEGFLHYLQRTWRSATRSYCTPAAALCCSRPRCWGSWLLICIAKTLQFFLSKCSISILSFLIYFFFTWHIATAAKYSGWRMNIYNYCKWSQVCGNGKGVGRVRWGGRITTPRTPPPIRRWGEGGICFHQKPITSVTHSDPLRGAMVGCSRSANMTVKVYSTGWGLQLRWSAGKWRRGPSH